MRVPVTVCTPNYSDYEDMHTNTHIQGVCLCAVCIVCCIVAVFIGAVLLKGRQEVRRALTWRNQPVKLRLVGQDACTSGAVPIKLE